MSTALLLLTGGGVQPAPHVRRQQGWCVADRLRQDPARARQPHCEPSQRLEPRQPRGGLPLRPRSADPRHGTGPDDWRRTAPSARVPGGTQVLNHLPASSPHD